VNINVTGHEGMVNTGPPGGDKRSRVGKSVIDVVTPETKRKRQRMVVQQQQRQHDQIDDSEGGDHGWSSLATTEGISFFLFSFLFFFFFFFFFLFVFSLFSFYWFFFRLEEASTQEDDFLEGSQVKVQKNKYQRKRRESYGEEKSLADEEQLDSAVRLFKESVRTDSFKLNCNKVSFPCYK
jgi:hypothetical protein